MLDFFGRRVLGILEQSSQIVLDAQQEIGNVRWFNMAVRGQLFQVAIRAS